MSEYIKQYYDVDAKLNSKDKNEKKIFKNWNMISMKNS